MGRDKQMDGDLVALTFGHRPCHLRCIVQTVTTTWVLMTGMDAVHAPKTIRRSAMAVAG